LQSTFNWDESIVFLFSGCQTQLFKHNFLQDYPGFDFDLAFCNIGRMFDFVISSGVTRGLSQGGATSQQ